MGKVTSKKTIVEQPSKSVKHFLNKNRGRNKKLEQESDLITSPVALKSGAISLVQDFLCEVAVVCEEKCQKSSHKRRRRKQNSAKRCLTTAYPDNLARQVHVSRETGFAPVGKCKLALPLEHLSQNVERFSDKKRDDLEELEPFVEPNETKTALEHCDSGSIKTKNDLVACQRIICSQQGEFYAALDLGTNNCRLLIAQPSEYGDFRVVDGFSRLVRLGEGISCSNKLKPQAMERTIEALKMCREKLSRWNIVHQRLVATEACRSTLNGEEFVARVRHETGLEIEVVDRETEARLAVAGCGSLVEHGTRGAILFDIGGGSSEIALLDLSKHHSPRLAEHIIAWTSLPVGVVTLAERFGASHVSYQDFRRMKAYVSELLYQFSERDRLGALTKCPSFHLIGTSGTVTMLAGIHLNLKYYDRQRVDGMWLYGHEVSRLCQRLLSWDIKQRAANPCIGHERADLVLAGCAILEAIRTVWPSRRLRVADRGVREGILTELMIGSQAESTY